MTATKKKKSYTFKLKSYLFLNSKKMHLSLNTYRNLHYTTNNALKNEFKFHYFEQIRNCPEFDGPVNITFKMTKSTKIKSDKSNFYSVISKYLFDALVEAEKLEDDNDDFIKRETLCPSAYNPKLDDNLVEITIREV